MDRLNVGIVGAGFAAGSHIEALRRVPGLTVAGVAASSPERSWAAAAYFGLEKAYDSFETMVAASEIDAVHNCTPNDLHAVVTTAALESGKHVLSEKPLGLTSEETARLSALADDAGVVTGVCHNYRHYPLMREAKQMLASGEYGTPHLVHGSYLQDWLLFDDDWNWRLESDRAGASRAVADIGSHWLDLVQYLTQAEVTRVCARLSTLHPKRSKPSGSVQTFAVASAENREHVHVDTEDLGVVLLEFDNGIGGSLVVSQVSPGRKNRLWFEIDTARAGIAWDQEDPNRLWVGRRDAPNTQLMRDASLLSPPAAALVHYPGGHEEGWADGLRNLMEDFYAAVRARRAGIEHRPQFATFAEAHQVTTVVEAILDSHHRGEWADVARGQT
jgi:predicted dehydrogenase